MKLESQVLKYQRRQNDAGAYKSSYIKKAFLGYLGCLFGGKYVRDYSDRHIDFTFDWRLANMAL